MKPAALCAKQELFRMKLSLNRSIWSYSKVQMARASLTRNNPRFMNLKKPGLILDVGCGPNTRPENINLDYSWHPGIDICCDITRGLLLPDRYVRGIFTEHCLEHIPLAATKRLLSEFFRVLQPGGSVRIVVPDLDIYVESLRTGTPAPYADLDRVDGIYTPAMSLNRIMYDHGHRFIYDFTTLKALLDAAGFSDVRKCAFGRGATSMLFDSPSRAPESLYVEAGKCLGEKPKLN
jgi:predicted SAM-dependent methyltransferase